jgi:hypothetical protein
MHDDDTAPRPTRGAAFTGTGILARDVIAGLDPAIHLLRKMRLAKRMDRPNSGLPKFGTLSAQVG